MNESEQQTTEKPNSCEISINAQGKYSGKVKAYAATVEEAVELAVVKAQQLETLIKQKNE